MYNQINNYVFFLKMGINLLLIQNFQTFLEIVNGNTDFK